MKKYCLAIVLVALLALVGCAEHEHSWDSGVVTKPATCTEKGEMTYTCLVCEVQDIRTIPATGHSYEWKTLEEADCVNDGRKKGVCSECGDERTEVVKAAHKYDAGDDECTVCHNKKTDIENAEARIGTKYFATLTDAIKSLKAAESKTATINILVDSVNLDVINNVLPKENHYSISIIGKGRDNSTLTVLTTNGGSDGSRVHYADNVDLEFKSIKVDFGGNTNYQGFARATSLVFDNCIISGMASYWGVGETVFKNCVFEDNNNDYNLWLYSGSKFVFENCVFNSTAGKFINAYQPSNTTKPVEVVIDGCKFVGETEKYPAIFLKPQTIWKVEINNTECENVKAGSESGSVLYDVRMNEDGATVKFETTVTIDGAVVWENGAKKEN